SSQGQGQGQRGTLLGLGGLRRGIEEEPREHRIARAIVNDCLERGDDSVDLSGGNLRSIPSGLLRPLQHLTKLPAIKEPPVTEDVYTSLEPFLRLFLAGNALPKLCGELFELDTLRVLSLRNNKLAEIPTAIRRLTMLQEVNLSVNRLRSLPWELLWLIRKGDLKHLTVRPNPLLQIDDGAHDPEAAVAEWHVPREALRACVYEGPAPEQAWAPVHVATGPVRRYNAEGVLAGSSSSNRPCPAPLPPAASRVPSLREVALLSLTRSPSFDLLSDAELAGYPALMLRLLRDAREVRAAGGRSCSVCHRGFVLARTEWIEWWDCSTYENGLKGPRPSGEGLRPLPFRRLGCSWGCVPGAEI
ncbi:leucine-rich repeat domain-containing protein, partial [Aspergillus aculeatinus CBS 121060]